LLFFFYIFEKKNIIKRSWGFFCKKKEKKWKF